MTAPLLAELFARDLTRLTQELAAFPDDESLWLTVPGVTNPAGNLVLHLEGNLRQYIGRQMGGIAHHRDRAAEFGTKGLTKADLAARVAAIADWLPGVVSQLDANDLAATFPEPMWGHPIVAGQFLLHLYGHFQYHLGQIDYLRRIVTAGSAVEMVQLGKVAAG